MGICVDAVIASSVFSLTPNSRFSIADIPLAAADAAATSPDAPQVSAKTILKHMLRRVIMDKKKYNKVIRNRSAPPPPRGSAVSFLLDAGLAASMLVVSRLLQLRSSYASKSAMLSCGLLRLSVLCLDAQFCFAFGTFERLVLTIIPLFVFLFFRLSHSTPRRPQNRCRSSPRTKLQPRRIPSFPPPRALR